jgi:hypothetical protein
VLRGSKGLYTESVMEMRRKNGRSAGDVAMRSSARWSFCMFAVLFGVAWIPAIDCYADAPEALHDDVVCAVVGIRASSSSDEARRVAGLITALYYLGRVDSRAPNGKGDPMISEELSKMTDLEFRSEAARCGNALALKGQWIERVAKALSGVR